MRRFTSVQREETLFSVKRIFMERVSLPRERVDMRAGGRDGATGRVRCLRASGIIKARLDVGNEGVAKPQTSSHQVPLVLRGYLSLCSPFRDSLIVSGKRHRLEKYATSNPEI